jgi:hypothetical protein
MLEPEPTLFSLSEYDKPPPPWSWDWEDNAPVHPLVEQWQDTVRKRLAEKREQRKRKPDTLSGSITGGVIEKVRHFEQSDKRAVIESFCAKEIDIEVKKDNIDVKDNDPSLSLDPWDISPINRYEKKINTGTLGTYKKGDSQYYRYSYRENGKVKHHHIGPCGDRRAWKIAQNISYWINMGRDYKEILQKCLNKSAII